MKQAILRYAILFLLLALPLSVLGCSREQEPSREGVRYDEARIEEYVRLETYEGLTVSLPDANATKGEAIWQELLAKAQVLSYPEEALSYYEEQRRETYRYYAKKNDWSYEETLSFFGVTEEEIQNEAKNMVKGDLVFRYIVKQAKISLTEEDKAAQLDRYVQKYAKDYGYSEEYIRQNMLELIYDSMLYDKTMEYLIVHNTFITP